MFERMGQASVHFIEINVPKIKERKNKKVENKSEQGSVGGLT